MLVINMILLYKLFYYIFVSKDGELLLNRRLLFLGYVQLDDGGVDVFHHIVLLERESNVNARTVDELIK